MQHVVERLERNFSFRTQDDLRIDATTAPDDPILALFYEGYDRAFILANEKEELAGFKTCLALNQPPAYVQLRDTFGPFREVVFVATDPSNDGVIGGANFIAFPVECDGRLLLCANLNYVYADPARRRRGYLRRLVGATTEAMAALFPIASAQPSPPLVFLEQNDPLRLTAKEYAYDTEHSGIDQVDRIGIWTKLGARILDFPYVQPPLSEDHDADRTLLYTVLGAREAAIAPSILRQQLTRFFGISVLKGRDPASDPSAAAQLALLDELEARGDGIVLLDPSSWLVQLPPAGTPDRLREFSSASSLRDVLRRFRR